MKHHDTPLTGPQTAQSAADTVIAPPTHALVPQRTLSATSGGGTVYVIAPRFQQRHQAVCTCGWSGRRRRILRSLTANDAHFHALESGCAPARPLVHTALPNVAGEAS